MISINQLNKASLEGIRVIVRGDLDVPIEGGAVSDGSKLDAVESTLDYLTMRGAKVILIGHLGRPGGKIVDELKMNPIADYYSSKYKIQKLNIVTGAETADATENLKTGEILMLENLRFDPREEANDPGFSKELASMGDIYVNECFAACHREHASIVGIPKILTSYCGLRLNLEVENIGRVLDKPEKPLVVILGGIKLETKLPVISKFLSSADYILLGGKIGASYEGDNNYKILGPVDYAGERQDIGPKTIQMFKNVIKIAKTIVWNGPLGEIEKPEFMEGTKQIVQAIIDSKAYSLAGGGNTIDALARLKLKDKMSFVSMGGGAMLDFISGMRLPGLVSLDFYA